MVSSGRQDGADGQQSLGDLVALAAKDVSQLVRYEIQLAASELKTDAKRLGWAAGLGVVGLFVACLVVVLLCFALAFGLNAAGIWLWAAFLITAGACVLLILLAALIAYLKVRRVTGMKLTRKSVMEDLDVLRRAEPSADGSGQAVTNPATSSRGVGAGSATAEIPAKK